MNVLSYKGQPTRVVHPVPFDGIVSDNGLPSDIHGLPDGHRVICGLTYDGGVESLIECADLGDMQTLARLDREKYGIQELGWYIASSADCLEELIRRNQPDAPPPSTLPTSSWIVA